MKGIDQKPRDHQLLSLLLNMHGKEIYPSHIHFRFSNTNFLLLQVRITLNLSSEVFALCLSLSLLSLSHARMHALTQNVQVCVHEGSFTHKLALSHTHTRCLSSSILVHNFLLHTRTLTTHISLSLFDPYTSFIERGNPQRSHLLI